MITDEVAIERSMNRSEEIIEVLDNTFGDSQIMTVVQETYAKIIKDGLPLSYQLGTMWLEWAVKHPGRVGKRLQTKSCRCDNQWILENEENKTHRPCPKCLPEAHDKWVGRTIGTDDEDDEQDRGMFDGE